MKKITLSADGELIERARRRAEAQGRSLNDAFQEWLWEFASSKGEAPEFDELMPQLANVDSGGHYTREELNQRCFHFGTSDQ